MKQYQRCWFVARSRRLSGTVNKNWQSKIIQQCCPSFLAFDDIESLNESTAVSSGISAGEAISKLDFTGESGGTDLDVDLGDSRRSS